MLRTTDAAGATRALLAQRALLLILLSGLAGAGVELLLLEHTEDTWQLVPLALIPLSIVVLLWQAWRASAPSRITLYIIMALNTLSGAVGTFLHYRGNVEFELEMYPALSGVALFREAMMGATPAFAPGSMTMFGLLGFLYAYLSESRN